jgi:hypothetical protein
VKGPPQARSWVAIFHSCEISRGNSRPRIPEDPDAPPRIII